MYGEEFIRNEYNTGRRRWFEKMHPTLCGNLPEWRAWKRHQERLHKLIRASLIDLARDPEVTPEPEPVVIQ